MVQCIPQRYIVIVMTLIALINTIAMRSTLYLVLTQMVQSHDGVEAVDEYSCPMPTDGVANGTVTIDVETVSNHQFVYVVEVIR